jgi:hypothetical protein
MQLGCKEERPSGILLSALMDMLALSWTGQGNERGLKRPIPGEEL